MAGPARPELPIDAHLEAVRRAVATKGAVVVEAEPGAGKTTRIPEALLDQVDGAIVVVEPRRLAARMAARHVARTRHERCGDTIGYQVRFDDRTGPRTRVRYVTEGVLLRQLRGHPTLPGVGAVVLDEVHERHLAGDLALALLAHRRRAVGDLPVVAMSATLDAAPIASLLEAPTVQSRGRRFDVHVEYEPPGKDDLATAVAKAVRRCLREERDGHVLVFLPGIGAIRRAEARCAALARDEDVDLLALHGELPPDEQDRAVGPSSRRKVILSTNVAESSVTIDGVTAVVDSGVHRVARTGEAVGELVDRPISQASAVQRTGRAGRNAPGRCIRLYGEGDFHARPAFDEPEITRSDLSEARLTLALVGVDPQAVPWLTPPPQAELERATESLRAIGALTEAGVTSVGRRLADLPLSPRLGRVLVEARDRGVEEPVATALALLSEGVRAGRSVDLWHHVDAFERARAARFAPAVVRRLDLRRSVRRADRARDQLLRACRRMPAPSRAGEDEEEAAAAALAAGFADRIGRRSGQRDGAPILALSSGGRALLPERAPRGDLFVVLEARRTSPTHPPRAELVAALPFDVLLDAVGDAIELEEELLFDAGRGRVESVGRMRYQQLVLEETRAAATPGEEAAAVLVEAARQAELHLTDAIVAMQMRIGWAHRHDPSFPPFDEAALGEAMSEAAAFTVALSDLRAIDWPRRWLDRLPSDDRRRLRKLAPAQIQLASGQRLEVRYGPDGPPAVGSYLQDFFGMSQGPTAAGEAIVLELWAPNRRPIQVTTDLAGFWTRHYPDLRRQLSRRYPKHHWPDAPTKAKPVRLKRHL